MNQIIDIAQKNNLKIVEDATQAHGAEIDNKKMVVMEMQLRGAFILQKFGGIRRCRCCYN